MKYFWTLPVTLRLAIAAQHAFSVNSDLFAFPQYEVVFSESFVGLGEASKKLELGVDRSEKTSLDLIKQQQVLGEGTQEHTSDGTYERMVLHDRPFLCAIPQVSSQSEDNSTVESMQQQDLIKASDSGSRLLQDMKGNCLYSGTGWWLYAFCYGEQISQFHPLPPTRGRPLYPPTPDPAVTNFELGRFQNDEKKNDELVTRDQNEETKTASSDADMSAHLQTRGESNFLVQKLGGGTKCDLTGDARQIEVQYHCNPNFGDRISMVKEVATCSYLMVIHTPKLCNEAAFLPPQISRPNPITCQEIVSPDEEDAWKKGKAAQAAYELFKSEQENGPPEEGQPRRRPIVGGIELGGQKLVGGTPERTIKATKLARPPKMDPKQEKYIATLASSDGKQTTIMNEREIRKHDLTHSLEQIEDYILQTEEWAENVRPGQPWKLDVVQTANGAEYRGILIANDENSEEEGQAVESSETTSEGSQEEYKQPEKRP
ncbi:MAG: hypothetical protein Q9159_001826 [Coniocarpon cinnabarinum]